MRILVVNRDVVATDRDAGSLRLFRLLEILAEEGHEITYVARECVAQERAIARLAGLGIEVFPSDPERMRALGAPIPPGGDLDFTGIVTRGRFDLALLSFFNVAEQYLPLIRAHSPLTPIVIDTVDVHHVRERRGAELNGDPIAMAGAERTREREQAIYSAADALVAVSEQDAGELSALAPDVPCHVIATIHRPVGSSPGFAERSGLVFVGGFAHAPNADGVLDFHHRAWPLIQAELPDVPLTLVGAGPPPAVTALASGLVQVTGWVPEVEPYLDVARVSIAPLRFGAGVKGKIGEALSHGLPVVTTSIGAEGMSLVDGEHALVADTPERFAAAALRLHRDRPLWEHIRDCGRSHIDALLGTEAARAGARRLLAQVARTPFVLRAAAPGADRAVATYARTFSDGDRTSLILSVPAGDDAAAQAAFTAAAGTLEAEGLDPDAVADIQIAAAGPELTLPARAVHVGEAGGERAIAADAPAASWRELAGTSSTPRPARRDPRGAVLVHAADDAETLSAQLQAIRSAGLPHDVELVLAVDAPGRATEAVLRTLSGVRIIRGATALGRHQAWQLAAESSRAAAVVALAPLAVPTRGAVDALLASVRAGAALAGPIVDGAFGVDAGPDGSIIPRSAPGEGAPAALLLDCVATSRELMAEGLPSLPYGEGHVELQLARWAADRGGSRLVREARVDRLGAPDATVIICTRNRAEELPDGVALVLAAGAGDVVIVDNDSSDDTADVAAELARRSGGRVRVVAEPRGGLCHARNAGAAAARHDLLLYVDDDARVVPGWLHHAAHALARTGVANVGGPIAGLWPADREPGWPGRSLEPLLSILDLGDAERRLAPPDVVYGANWGVRRDALNAVGGFDPDFGPGPEARINGDEVSVAWRLHQAGLGTTVYVPGAAVGHRISPDRLGEEFLVHRALCVGVEVPRHAVALGRAHHEQLLASAESAAGRFAALAPLAGDLTVSEALASVARMPVSREHRIAAAMSLGELSANVVLLGEREAVLGDLRLRIDRDSLLRGVLAPVPAAA